MDHRDVAWEWVTGTKLLSTGPCELLSAYLVVSAASTDSYLYEGTNTNGRIIVTLEASFPTGGQFRPAEPVYCRNGLYAVVGTNVTGIFVQWRELRK